MASGFGFAVLFLGALLFGPQCTAWRPKPGTALARPRRCAHTRVLASSTDDFAARFSAAARAVAEEVGIEFVGASWKPPLLNVQIGSSASSQDLQDVNSQLSDWLDAEEARGATDMPAGEFDLEVGTPGVSELLTQDFEFEVFKGFEVIVTTTAEHKGKTTFDGTLHSREESFVVLNKTGRLVKIPRDLVEAVRLPKAKDGDRA